MPAFYPNTPPTFRYQLSHVLGVAHQFRDGFLTALIRVSDERPPEEHFGTPVTKVETYQLCRDNVTDVLSAKLNASPDEIICYVNHNALYKDLKELLPEFKKAVLEASSTAKITIHLANATYAHCTVFDDMALL